MPSLECLYSDLPCNAIIECDLGLTRGTLHKWVGQYVLEHHFGEGTEIPRQFDSSYSFFRYLTVEAMVGNAYFDIEWILALRQARRNRLRVGLR